MNTCKWNLLWAIPVGIVFFLLVEVFVFLPIFVVGLVLLPFFLWFGTITVDNKSLLHFKNQTLDELFGNFEDGLCPLWWSSLNYDKDSHYSAYLWFIRNPVTNMRRWPIVSTIPSKSVKWVGNVDEIPPDGKPGWFVAWQGPYAGFRWQNEKRGVWVGWKTSPRDAKPDAPRDYRYDGLGTALQYMRF